MAGLFDSIRYLKGVGEARAKLFAKVGVETIYDLLTYFPRAYEDRTKMVDICDLEVDVPACFRAMVVSAPRTNRIRKGLELTKVTVADPTGRLNLTFFNQSYIAQQLGYGQTYLFYGTLSGDYLGYGMTNPVVEDPDKPGVLTRRIVPVYALTSGLTNGLINRTVRQALELCGQIPEVLSEDLQTCYDLIPASQAYRDIHDPENQPALAAAQKRLSFEEFFIFSAGLQLLRQRRRHYNKTPFTNTDLTDFYQALPFRLTDAQQRVIGEICADFAGTAPMCRLVQGDVGSGKTMVAAAAMVCAAKNGLQSAFMAPTEILAEQHYHSLQKLLSALGLRCALLTGSMKQSEKKAVRAELEDGTIQIVIGTHALLSDTTTFAHLGLVVTDEQHRFGVAQRSTLSRKGDAPHLLLMSATPIPRTLAMILYGDLDVSVIDTLPPGRQAIDTFLVGEDMRARINAFIRKQVEAGHQCFIVCPAIEESDTESLKSAQLWAETLQQTVFPDLRVALLHGKMKGAEKESVMAAFARGDADILVATTVIEVGVDVPNANLIVIENADRFGLSQLHQLRGRVGRGNVKSYCVLFSSNRNPDTQTRLKALCKTTDGFAISQADLDLRGPGDLFGARQHGLPVFRCADLGSGMSVLVQAQEAAAAFIADEAAARAPEFAPLMERICQLFENGGELFL